MLSLLWCTLIFRLKLLPYICTNYGSSTSLQHRRIEIGLTFLRMFSFVVERDESKTPLALGTGHINERLVLRARQVLMSAVIGSHLCGTITYNVSFYYWKNIFLIVCIQMMADSIIGYI